MDRTKIYLRTPIALVNCSYKYGIPLADERWNDFIMCVIEHLDFLSHPYDDSDVYASWEKAFDSIPFTNNDGYDPYDVSLSANAVDGHTLLDDMVRTLSDMLMQGVGIPYMDTVLVNLNENMMEFVVTNWYK